MLKIKKIVAGTYEVQIGNFKFEIYQNLSLFDKGWELRDMSNNNNEWIDTFPNLNSAKEYLTSKFIQN